MNTHFQIEDEYYQLVRMIRNYFQYYRNMGIVGIPLDQQTILPNSIPSFISMKELHAYFNLCLGCPQAQKRKKTILGEGNIQPTLVFIGQSPTEEDEKPFQGEAGELFNKILAAIQLTREEVYLTYAIKCHIPEGESINHQAARFCRQLLLEELQLLRPSLICTFDTLATQMVLGKQGLISDLRGKILPLKLKRNRGRKREKREVPSLSVKVIPTYSPGFLLQNPQEKRPVWLDMQLIRKEYDQAQS